VKKERWRDGDKEREREGSAFFGLNEFVFLFIVVGKNTNFVCPT